MRLFEFLARANVKPDLVSKDADVEGISCDSRTVTPKSLFVCMPSTSGDSHRFAGDAIAAGAAAVLCHDEAAFRRIAQRAPSVFVKNEGHRLFDAVWRVAAEALDHPSAKLRVIGVTGTNGKTTTASIIRDALNSLGRSAAYLGTIGFQLPGMTRELANTTPFSIETQQLIKEAVDRGCTDLCMEVSSHALEQRRADGVEFDLAVFTNLSQDHLDFHPSMEAYEAAKFRLFSELPVQTKKKFIGVINIDDPVGARWRAMMVHPFLTYGLEQGEVQLSAPSVDVTGIRFVLRNGDQSAEVSSRLTGDYNVYNLLSAAAALIALGYQVSDVAKAIGAANPVPGRFEAVHNTFGIGVIVDYAHTPDALQKLLRSARQLCQGKLICVFGCGGDRDRDKRPKMASAASTLADLVIITSDNPRNEVPSTIISEIETGIQAGSQHESIVDRREAIVHACKVASPNDLIVIAGKGHENYQIIGTTKHPMDDRELVREGLAARSTGSIVEEG